MTKPAIIAISCACAVLFAAGVIWYIITSERAKLRLENASNTIEGIRDAREIENETRDDPDDGLRGILIDGVR